MNDDIEILDGPTDAPSRRSDERAYSYRVKQGTVVHTVLVVIPRSLLASSPAELRSVPTHRVGGLAADIVETKGRSALELALARGRVPKRVNLGYLRQTFGDED
jgi:hypothetical protein